MAQPRSSPPSCSWFNAVEGYFAKLTTQRLKHGIIHSPVDLKAAINRFIPEHDRTRSRPFICKASPGPIEHNDDNMTTKISKFLINTFALPMLATLVSLFVLEFFAQFYCKPQTRHQDLFVEYDPLLGWRKIANNEGLFITAEYQVIAKTNSHGFRGPEFTVEKSSDAFRVLVLGDSFAEGYTVNVENLFSEVIRRNLEQSNKFKHYDVEIINTGTAGYSTDQELIMFMEHGIQYNPDLTILLFYHNDVLSNNQSTYWRGAKPMFKLTGEDLILTNVPVPKPNYTRSDKNAKLRANAQEEVQSWLQTHSSLYCLIVTAIKSDYRIYNFFLDLFSSGKENRDLVPAEMHVWDNKGSKEIADAWNITERIIKKLKQETQTAKSQLLVVYVPFRAEIYDEEWKDTKRRYGISGERWRSDLVSTELESICAKYGIPFLDPTTAFRSHVANRVTSGDRLYFIGDGHWTPSGHHLIGELIARRIEQMYSIGSRLTEDAR